MTLLLCMLTSSGTEGALTAYLSTPVFAALAFVMYVQFAHGLSALIVEAAWSAQANRSYREARDWGLFVFVILLFLGGLIALTRFFVYEECTGGSFFCEEGFSLGKTTANVLALLPLVLALSGVLFLARLLVAHIAKNKARRNELVLPALNSFWMCVVISLLSNLHDLPRCTLGSCY